MIRTLLRVALGVPLLAIGIGTASAAARVGPAAPLCARAGAPHRVGIVVEHGDGRVVRECVGFATSTISALAVLQASGIENRTESYGTLGSAVCQIDNEPAGYSTCLPTSGSYWVLFVAHSGGAWTDSAQGASSTTVTDGDDVGFRYDPQAGPDPAPAPAGICPSATAPPASTSSPATAAPATSHPLPARSPGAPASPSTSPNPTAAVLGPASPAITASPLHGIAPAVALADPLNAGLLAGACGAGALLGLLGVLLVRRRRR